MKGRFQRPPLAADGFLYALSRDGVLSQLSSRPGANARQMAQIEASPAAFNRAALVNVSGADRQGLVRGRVFLTVNAARVEAVSLLDGLSTVLYEAHPAEPIVANRSEGDTTGFKGLAANGEFFAFVLRNERGDNLLTLQYLDQDRPGEQPITLEGGQVAGPAMCDRQIVFCTKRQAALYDQETQTPFVLDLPSDFEPLFSPCSEDLHIAPGSMPFAIEPRDLDRHTIHIAGLSGGGAGLLQIDFEQDKKSFRPVPRGSSLSANGDGVACLAVLDSVEVFGAEGAKVHRTRLQPGMPAYYAAPYVASFSEVDFVGRHRVNLASSSRSIDLQFEDDRCNEDSCCGIYLLGPDVAVAYLDVGAGDQGEGLRLARWSPR